MQEQEIFYAAISGTILAIELETGREVWRQAISKGVGVTTIYPRGSRVIAAAAGDCGLSTRRPAHARRAADISS